MDIKVQSINFKSGITPQILEMERKIIPRYTESYFRNLENKDWRSFYNIDFKDNKAMAAANRLCADIFNTMRKFFDYRKGRSSQELLYPQDLYVYNREDSVWYTDKGFFVNTIDARYENNKPVFNSGTVFMPNEIKDLELIDSLTEKCYEERETSTPHFLNAFIHEWLHAIFYKTTNNICFNYNYDYDKTWGNYFVQQFTDKEKEIISDTLRTYSIKCKTKAYAELFADSWTKFICDSLAEDCKTFKKNPLELMKATPKEFQEILQKTQDIKFLK